MGCFKNLQDQDAWNVLRKNAGSPTGRCGIHGPTAIRRPGQDQALPVSRAVVSSRRAATSRVKEDLSEETSVCGLKSVATEAPSPTKKFPEDKHCFRYDCLGARVFCIVHMVREDMT